MPPGFDPSKLDPQALAELTRLVQELPPTHLMKMQTLMHNAMAGHDTRRDMEEFERNLPAGFREKLMGVLTKHSQTFAAAAAIPVSAAVVSDTPSDLREARLTILRAVAEGRMTPEAAEALL